MISSLKDTQFEYALFFLTFSKCSQCSILLSGSIKTIKEGNNYVVHKILKEGYPTLDSKLTSSTLRMLSHVWLLATPQTVALQAPPSMGFSRQEDGESCHFLLQGIFLTQGPRQSLSCLPTLAGGSLPLRHH